ncbi:MAG: NAD+ synthase [Gammaproteobacteria bacterium]|nr:NAD+ synthase [Gammaproteobacteria bacterium]NDB25770.1 NAD+ synthase [Gammaproteobacteria bacterium]NDE87032.1 NAD+ synthase [Gammaproteobacteria bacterium]
MTDGRLTIALAQLDLLVGDIDGNAARVQDTAAQLGTAPSVVDLVVFPELTLAGYPPEDLLFHRGFRHQIERALERCTRTAGQPAMLLGFPEYTDAGIYNSVALLASGAERARYRKTCLPNYGVFDEQRYFARGNAPLVIESSGFRLGILICEDIWQRDPAQEARVAGAELLLVTNASPYEQGKQAAREAMLRERAIETGLPIVYVNLVGAQDELVFDGQSVVVDRHGNVVLRAAAFVEALATIEFTRDADGRAVPRAAPDAITPPLAEAEEVYRALVQGVRDYVGKHRFPGVVLGLSGGIDSALTLAIAVDALGAERVQAVMMPSRYTAQMSLDDAALQASRLGVKYSVIPIEDMFAATLAALAEEFAGRPVDATEENIQSRCRMQLLMGISNKTGRMLLTTGNKSEMAVGYATLYGDMAGGFAPIKDCSKLLVYRLAEWRNTAAVTAGESVVIPARVIERAPSAELRPDQKDVDSLPPYEILDPILEAFIEHDQSVEEIVARGYDKTTVGRVLDLVKRNEYKRRQAPPGVRVSRRAFGRDWRYPITSGYRR